MDADQPPVRERLRNGNSVLYYVPFLNHPITINEFHAHVLGFVTGVVVAFGYVEGFEGVAVFSTVVLVGYAVVGGPRFRSCSHDDERYNQRVGLRTLRWEPWHYLGLFLLGTVVVLLLG